ncbi:MAG: hypothetical protein A2Z20_07980 [Bdellovibrionales bacterium RBG_16_40_8]|nr:MAG: hypothetical protein A2Z20_07980 [Bdellovibrionales bacterium RBG_16_40_8]
MKTVFLVLVLMLYGALAQPSNIDLDNYLWERLKAARNVEELREQRKNIEDLKVILRSCHIQLNENLIPTQCYNGLKVAHRLAVQDKIDIRLAELDRKCIGMASKTSETEVNNLNLISPTCQKAATERIVINRYKFRHVF